MKKIVLSLLAVVVFVSLSFAKGAEVNVRAGLDFSGKAHLSSDYDMLFDGTDHIIGKNVTDDTNTNNGFSVSGEFLYKLGEKFKLGAGLEYLFPRKISEGLSVIKFAYIPVYITAQINPISKLNGIFAKLNLGYVASFDAGNIEKQESYKSKSGGIYYGIAAGYEFPFGLILDLSYSSYSSGAKFEYNEIDTVGWVKNDFTYTKIGLSAGYKFKLF